MKRLAIFSILGFFVLTSGIIMVPSAFADKASVSIPTGSSVPGCEETNECWVPAEVTVDVGGEVTWSNDDSAAHTVTSGDPADADSVGAMFDSGLLLAGGTFSQTFEEASTVDYFCIVHPWMQGTVVVQEAMAEEEMMEEETMMEEDKMMEMEKMMVGKVDITMSPPVEGSADAPVTIVEFGDFQCPKCDQWFLNEKPTIKTDYIDTGKANLYFVDFPFLGADSDAASNASYCADDQGKYREFHDTLYNNQGGINDGWANNAALKQFAADIGLSTSEFDACLDSGKYDDRVAYNKQVAASHGVEGTPVFLIINSDGTTERIDGPQPSAIFADTIGSFLGEAMAQEMEDDEMMEEETMMEEDKEEGGGCLIATAAFGSELSPQVQFLREVRDNTLLSTTSGATFMTGFNQMYYSFSPAIADLERENPVFKETVKLFITPMLSTLSIMTLADEGSESQVLGLGSLVIALNLGMYIAAPAAVGFAVHKRLKSKSP